MDSADERKSVPAPFYLYVWLAKNTAIIEAFCLQMQCLPSWKMLPVIHSIIAAISDRVSTNLSFTITRVTLFDKLVAVITLKKGGLKQIGKNGTQRDFGTWKSAISKV